MKVRSVALPILAAAGSVLPLAALAQEAFQKPATYVAKVEPGAFQRVPFEENKLGVTVDPATLRLITPGIDKFSIYKLIGPPHFNEGITRRWNYVLFFPEAPGSVERIRCRMEIRFVRPRGHYNVVVSDVIWQEQACADRVAKAS